MIERIEVAFENERRFVADASHELRTPIAVVKTELEAALSLRDDPELLLDSLRSAIDECDGLAQIADDLLIVARLADGQLPLACQPIDVAKLLDDARLRFVDRATRHGRSIHVDVDGDQTVFVDPTRIRQVLSNLIDNSLRHGAGDITLRARRNPDTQRVSIDVIDQGAGFADSIAATAFERFTRGDRARTRTTGAGLGMSIVRSLVHAHHGTVTILPGRPTTVRLELS
jgi:signal transduction histidine kinase